MAYFLINCSDTKKIHRKSYKIGSFSGADRKGCLDGIGVSYCHIFGKKLTVVVAASEGKLTKDKA